jgi:hypothetical protein
MTLRKEFLNIFNILATPSEVFIDIKTTPRWRMAFFVVLISSVTIGWFMIPAMEQPMKSIYSKSFGESGAEAAISTMMRFYFMFEVILQPALIFIRWAMFSIMLYLLSRYLAAGVSVSYNQIFSATGYCEIIFILMNMLNVLIIYAKGLEKIESGRDLTIFRGLDFFMNYESRNTALTTLLTNINAFSIWYVIVISIAIRILTEMKRSVALFLSAICWLLWATLSMIQPILVKVIMETIS